MDQHAYQPIIFSG